MARKVYVRVIVEFDQQGGLWPRSIIWENGCQYRIDRILDVSPGVSTKVGGFGIRYNCRIMGRQVPLFLEDKRWFVEAGDQK